MKRTKPTNGNIRALTRAPARGRQPIHSYSVLLGRARLMARLGQQYDGDRNIYQALGYDLDLTFDKYNAQYQRQDIAKAIINRPVEATWRGGFELLESADVDETTLESKWKELMERLMIMSKFARLDRLAGIGHYGVLLLGLDDVEDVKGFLEPVQSGDRELIYVKPLSEGSADITKWQENSTDARFGLPEIYELIVRSSEDGSGTEEIIRVHHSRIVHAQSSELLESETHGVPRLQAVFNRLKDLEKLVGASAEMFWRGARPGYQGKVDEDFQVTDDFTETIQNQINEFEHNLRRIMINEGVDLKALEMQIADPAAHVDVQLQMIAAVTGIPKRILTGSELGELASTQDLTNWLSVIASRREEYTEPIIVRPFINRCIEYGILPAPKDDYSIQWTDLWTVSAKEKASIGETMAKTIAAYGGNPNNESIIPPNSFYKLILGLDEDQIEIIEKEKEEAIKEDEKLMEEEARLMEEDNKLIEKDKEEVVIK